MAMIKAKEPKVGNIGPFGKRMTKKNVNMQKKGTKKAMKIMDPLKLCKMSQEERKEYAKKALGKILNMALR